MKSFNTIPGFWKRTVPKCILVIGLVLLVSEASLVTVMQVAY